ncbi:MAG: NuoM family protein [Anaerolineaceae bacterium]
MTNLINFPILSSLLAAPLLFGLVILLLPATHKKAPRVLAFIGGGILFVLSVIVYFSFNKDIPGYQFVESIPWLPALGISYRVGVDGISAPMILLTGIVVLAGIVVSWKVEDRPREFFTYLLFLGVSVAGVFLSLDVFQLFFFLEIAVFPKYLMIIMWGWPQKKEYGGMKLTLYLFLGSMIALAGILAVVSAAGINSFDLVKLMQVHLAPGIQKLWFPFIFIGFAILGGLFPFYNWAPDGHVAAPTAVSMLLAGVEMKVGVFAALRLGIMLLPDGAKFWAPLIILLATINIVYGAFLALVQTDFKYIIGFSSVSHMGFVLLGFAALNHDGLLGAGMQMFSHGVMTALFFAIVGMVYDRTHTRDLGKLGGLAQKLPVAAFGFIIAGLVSMGMPGFSGFVSEFPIFMGVWQVSPIAAIVAVVGVVITAAYILRTIGKVFFGKIPGELPKEMPDIPIRDKIVVISLSLVLISMGVFPALIAPVIEQGTSTVLALLGGG